jgi:hypothetical protein
LRNSKLSTAYILSIIYAYTRSPVEIRTPTLWNLIGRSMTAPQPVLSPNSILPPHSTHCAFILTRKISASAAKMLSIQFIYLFFFFNFRNLKQLERGVYVNMEIWGNGSWQGEKPKCDTFSSHLHCLALESSHLHCLALESEP